MENSAIPVPCTMAKRSSPRNRRGSSSGTLKGAFYKPGLRFGSYLRDVYLEKCVRSLERVATLERLYEESPSPDNLAEDPA